MLKRLDKVMIARLTAGEATAQKSPRRQVMEIIRRVIRFFDKQIHR